MATTHDHNGKKMKKGDRVTTLNGKHAGKVIYVEVGGWSGVQVDVQWDDREIRPRSKPQDLIVMDTETRW